MSQEIRLDLFTDLSACLHGAKLKNPNVFAWVGKSLGTWLDSFLTELGVGDTPVIKGQVHPGAYISGRVFIDEGAVVEPTAYIQGPCYIGPRTEVRHGAYIRGDVYVGPDAVVGHTTEVKGSMFLDGAKAGHFAYVGDSLLGRNVNLGAGTKLANLPLQRKIIRVWHPETNKIVSTELKKFSAVMGDDCQTGCNAVLSPGTLLLPGTGVMPCVHYRGTLRTGVAE
jgi:NDP-sugar pyrophosphorylase family protein